MKGWAFWMYSQYPYVLGGAFSAMDDNGRVYVPAYSGWFRPVLILPPTPSGQELVNKIKMLEEAYQEAQRELFETHMRGAREQLPLLAHVINSKERRG